MVSRVIVAPGAALAVALSLSLSPAEAEDLAGAKALFESGLADMMAGRYEEGCPALAESYRLSSLPGAVFTLAECEAKWGKLASAQRHYQEYLERYVKLSPADRKRQAERKQIATDQIEALEGTIPRLTILLPAGAPQPKAITRDGASFPLSSIGTALPVDPGEHHIVVEWQGGTKKEHVRRIESGTRAELLLEPPARSDLTGGRGATRGDADAAPGEDPGQDVRVAGYVVLAIGLASLAAGGITGGVAMSTKTGIDDNCVGTVCTEEGKDAADTTQAFGNASTATFVIGGAALATGIILLLAAPSGDPEPAAADAAEPSAAVRALRPWVAVTPGPEVGALVGVRSRW
jgi:hypothetical protein